MDNPGSRFGNLIRDSGIPGGVMSAESASASPISAKCNWCDFFYAKSEPFDAGDTVTIAHDLFFTPKMEPFDAGDTVTIVERRNSTLIEETPLG